MKSFKDYMCERKIPVAGAVWQIVLVQEVTGLRGSGSLACKPMTTDTSRLHRAMEDGRDVLFHRGGPTASYVLLPLHIVRSWHSFVDSLREQLGSQGVEVSEYDFPPPAGGYFGVCPKGHHFGADVRLPSSVSLRVGETTVSVPIEGDSRNPSMSLLPVLLVLS